jgi:hypothetical protein
VCACCSVLQWVASRHFLVITEISLQLMVGSYCSECKLVFCPPMPLQLTGPGPWYYISPYQFWFFHVDIRGYILSYGSYCPTCIYFPGLLVHHKVWVRKEALYPTHSVLQVIFYQWNVLPCCHWWLLQSLPKCTLCHKYTLNHHRVCHFCCPNVLFSWDCIAWKWLWFWNFLRGCRI